MGPHYEWKFVLFPREFSVRDLPLWPLYNFGTSIITERKADLFSLLLCHWIVRMAPPFLMSL